MKELELNVKNIECTGCENRIQNALLNIKEIKKVKASHQTGKVFIYLKEDLTTDLKEQIEKVLEDMDFEIIK